MDLKFFFILTLNRVIMECGLLRGRIHFKWAKQTHNGLKSTNLVIEQKGRDYLEHISRVGKLSGGFKASSLSEDQLRCLDSYFRKLLKEDSLLSSSISSNKRVVLVKPSIGLEAKDELRFLEDYLSKVDKGNIFKSRLLEMHQL